MLELKNLIRGWALVQWTSPEKEWPELVDYNPILKRFDVNRHAYLLIPESTTPEMMRAWLRSKPQAMIMNTVSHDPILTATDRPAEIDKIAAEQRIIIDGVPYLDVFGFYTYITSQVVWETRSDVDLRFNSNHYPYRILTPELWCMATH